jgi:bifunctional non-homologous end joining protein LigD
MRVAMYARVSTDGKGQDPENQLRELRDWVINSGRRRQRTRPGLGVIEPSLPSPAKAPPSGLHEIKHDASAVHCAFDLLELDGKDLRREPIEKRKELLAGGVQLITRAGNDFSSRFPFIAMAVGKLPVRSCLIDGEAIVCDETGLAVFELIRRHGTIELLGGSQLNLAFNECFEENGAIVYREACKLGCEGIVSKRLGSSYRSGRSPHWIKVKNPNAPAVEREAEEDWR